MKIGKYEHYKGNQYEVLGIAKHSETLEEFVVYKALYGKEELWIRPLKMFLEEVDLNGKKLPRFKYIGE
jgi:cyclomaltodextrinase / maltogenic alpha-amylase / neopullulanase